MAVTQRTFKIYSFCMKPIIILLSLLFTSSIILAQPEPRRDTLAGGGSLSPWHLQAMRVPVLINPQQAKTFLPTEKLCFDKKIFIKSTGSGRAAEMYVYLNTEDGYIGILIGKEGTLGAGDIKPEEERFNFMVIGRKGNTYNYYNRKKKNQIEHYVNTGNSETQLYQFSATSPNSVIKKKNIRNMYCGDKFKTWSYKADGGDAPVMHIFGRTYPDKLLCKDFLGFSGVGYLETDKGTYIACELEKGASSFEMRAFDDVSVCFDPADFRPAEQEMYQKQTEGIAREREKLEGQTFSGDCSSEQNALKNIKKQMLDKKERNVQNAQQGNVYQNNNTQKAYADMMDPLDMVEVNIYEMDVKICKLQSQISKAASRGQNTSKMQEKMACYGRQKSSFQSAKSEMQSINTRYSNSPGQAFAEKSKVMMRSLQSCN